MISGDMVRDDLFATEHVNAARFFTNAVDTKTQGVDIKYNQVIDFENSSDLDLGIWYHYAKNEIVSFNDTTTISREGSFEQVDRVENGQPKDAIRVLSKYSIDKFIFTLNLSRYGSYSHVRDVTSYMFKPRINSDLDIAYKLSKTTTLNVGGHNIFDTYTNKWDGLSSDFVGYDGIVPYSQYSPFGFSGSFYYATATIKF
jgi:iron complex outermembrane receptor protein